MAGASTPISTACRSLRDQMRTSDSASTELDVTMDGKVIKIMARVQATKATKRANWNYLIQILKGEKRLSAFSVAIAPSENLEEIMSRAIQGVKSSLIRD